MNANNIIKLAHTIFDLAFAGEMTKPTIIVNPRPIGDFAHHYAWTDENGVLSHSVEIFAMAHRLVVDNDPLEFVDTITHEFVHGLQHFGAGGGRYGTHGRKFEAELAERLKVVRRFFKNG